MDKGKLHQHVLQVETYVQMHLYEKITVREMAELLHLHPSYLNTMFREQSGMSLKTYIGRQKTKAAMRLLSETEHSLSEICTMLGFFDQSHFSRTFRRFVGTTPGEYRKRLLSEVPEGTEGVSHRTGSVDDVRHRSSIVR